MRVERAKALNHDILQTIKSLLQACVHVPFLDPCVAGSADALPGTSCEEPQHLNLHLKQTGFLMPCDPRRGSLFNTCYCGWEVS